MTEPTINFIYIRADLSAGQIITQAKSTKLNHKLDQIRAKFSEALRRFNSVPAIYAECGGGVFANGDQMACIKCGRVYEPDPEPIPF